MAESSTNAHRNVWHEFKIDPPTVSQQEAKSLQTPRQSRENVNRIPAVIARPEKVNTVATAGDYRFSKSKQQVLVKLQAVPNCENTLGHGNLRTPLAEEQIPDLAFEIWRSLCEISSLRVKPYCFRKVALRAPNVFFWRKNFSKRSRPQLKTTLLFIRLTRQWVLPKIFSILQGLQNLFSAPLRCLTTAEVP